MLQQHLFPGDGKEAVAVALCGRHEREGISVLLVNRLELIPHEECERDPNFVKWKTDRLIPLLDEAEKYNLGILKIHSHPGGYPKFSMTDDKSDAILFPSIFIACGDKGVHGSAIMLPDSSIFGKVYTCDKKQIPLDKISVAGDEILSWDTSKKLKKDDEFSIRTRQAFGDGTYDKLSKLKIGVVGCSGTGGPTIEQLTRLGVGKLVLVDPDKAEKKNLNRIPYTTINDVEKERYKTDVFFDAINKIGLGTEVLTFHENLFDSKDALLELITCDIIFGCMDSVDGRHLLNQLTNFYLVPYFDLGVGLKADGRGGVERIIASVHYLQPGMSTLFSRFVYSMKDLEAAGIKRQTPELYQTLLKEKYIEGIAVDRPAVMPVNMLISSIAVMELLNRIHLFKEETPDQYGRVLINYRGGEIINQPESDFDIDVIACKWTGRGDCEPFLRMTELGI